MVPFIPFIPFIFCRIVSYCVRVLFHRYYNRVTYETRLSKPRGWVLLQVIANEGKGALTKSMRGRSIRFDNRVPSGEAGAAGAEQVRQALSAPSVQVKIPPVSKAKNADEARNESLKSYKSPTERRAARGGRGRRGGRGGRVGRGGRLGSRKGTSLVANSYAGSAFFGGQ